MYEVYEMKDYFDRNEDNTPLLVLAHRPGMKDLYQIGDGVYSVHAISDEDKRVGIKRIK